MPAPLSNDLRARVLEEAARSSSSAAAKRFGVHPNTALRWLQRLRDGLGVLPKPYRRGPRPKLGPQDLGFFLDLLSEDPSMTHAAMAQRFTHATDRPVTRQNVQTFFKKHQITRKKRRA